MFPGGKTSSLPEMALALLERQKAAWPELREGYAALDEIVTTLAARTDGFSGARLSQICQGAKRLAARETGFTRAVAPTMAHALRALDAEMENAG